jgi:hypothetical protein
LLTKSELKDPAVFEISSPRPVYQRGLWFDGVDDYLEITDFMFSTSFVFEAWVFAQVSTSFLEIEGILAVTTSQSGALFVTTESGVDYTGALLPTGEWALLTFTSTYREATDTTSFTFGVNSV